MVQWANSTEENIDLIDGYEELDDEAQKKVLRAIQQRHVDDEDWNGVSTTTAHPSKDLRLCHLGPLL